MCFQIAYFNVSVEKPRKSDVVYPGQYSRTGSAHALRSFQRKNGKGKEIPFRHNPDSTHLSQCERPRSPVAGPPWAALRWPGMPQPQMLQKPPNDFPVTDHGNHNHPHLGLTAEIHPWTDLVHAIGQLGPSGLDLPSKLSIRVHESHTGAVYVFICCVY